MVSLKLFGGASLEAEGRRLTGPAAHRHRLALLALLAASPSRALTRDKLISLLWPERDAEHARKLLNQSVYVLRNALGEDALLSAGEELQLKTTRMRCDVVAFEEALAEGDLERSVEFYTGPFLDGFHLSDATEFERWVDAERRRLSGVCAEALKELAETAEGRGDFRGAVEWWKALAAHVPYDSRVALRLMQALASDGNPAGALRHAAMHERLLREELAIEPPRKVTALAERLRREPEALARRGHEEGDIVTPGPGPSGTVEEPPETARPGGTKPPEAPAATWRHRALPDGVSPLLPGALVLVALFIGALVLTAIWRGYGPPDAPPAADEPAITVEDVARAVAREVDRRRQGDTAVRLPEHRTHSIAAYEFYLRGRDPVLLRSASGARQGLEYYRQAIALDSTYATAWAGLARFSIRVSTEDVTEMSREELLALAEEAALRAVALDDSLAEAHAALGLVRMGAFEFAAAESHLKRAIALDPDRTKPREWLVTVYLWTGRPAEALAVAERAQKLDPLSPSANAELSRALVGKGDCDDALARLEELKVLKPQLLRAADIAAQCHARTGRWRDAIAALRIRADQDAGPNRRALLGYMLGRAGEREEALRIRANLLERWRYDGGGAFPVAVVEAGLGDRDEAFAWLDRAVEDRSLRGWPPHLTVMDLLREALGDDPRFGGLRERIGLETG